MPATVIMSLLWLASMIEGISLAKHDNSIADNNKNPHAVKSSLMGHCPHCSEGAIFVKLLKPVQTCSVCGYNIAGSDVGDGPIVFVILAVGFIVLGLALWLEANFAPPLWLYFVLLLPLAAGLSLLLARILKGLLIGLHYNYNYPMQNDQIDNEKE